MATQLADLLFAVIAVAILVAQAFILRSTHRGMRFAQKEDGSPKKEVNRGLEWAYAVVPAVALVVLLLFSWRAMHPDSVQVRGVAPGAQRS